MKYPRNTFTLPIWLSIFPQARVISIERHGVDVAQSLRVRKASNLDEAVQTFLRYRSLFSCVPRAADLSNRPAAHFSTAGSPCGKNIPRWTRSMIGHLPADHSLALRCEDVLENPLRHLRESAEFCGLNISDSRLREVVASIKVDRANSYAADPKLRKFALDHGVELARLATRIEPGSGIICQLK